MADGAVAATFRLSAQPLAGDIVGRLEYTGTDQTGAQTITMSTHALTVWDMSGFTLVISPDEPADAPVETAGAEDAQSIVQRSRRLTGPCETLSSHCTKETLA